MAAEVKLNPGWLMRDVRKASERLDQWATSYNTRADASRGEERSMGSEAAHNTETASTTSTTRRKNP